ncbi:MAG: heparinase II/III domain-containing protein, partial [Promethearchaeota archaeon]
MALSRKTKFFIIIISILTVGNILLLFLAFQLFPAYGGFTRQIIFIKPNNNTKSNGYFIIIDELAQESQKYDIDWLLHSRGDLDIASDQQSFVYTVPSYITNDEISLEVTFLEEINEIEKKTGYFLPTHYEEEYPYDDLKISYCKATYSGSEYPIMATVLFPKNDSHITQSFPDISKKNSGLKIIGDLDYLYYNTEKTEKKFKDPDIELDGQMFFLRKNNTDPNILEFFYLQNAKSIKFEDIKYFSSSSFVKNILTTFANYSQISGYINSKEDKEIEINLYCPFNPKTLKIEGKDESFSYDNSIITFSIDNPCSFVVSKTNKYLSLEDNPLRNSAPDRDKPKKDNWEFDKNLIKDLSHPYTLFNETELVNLKNKIFDINKTWNSWYNYYVSGVDDIGNADDYEIEDLYNYIYKLTLKYIIDGGGNYLEKIKDFLKEIWSVEHYSQDLKRAYAVQAYAVALDMIYNDLSESERKKFCDNLYEQAKPLMLMDLYSENNHRVVDAGALGLAGLVLKNSTMVNKAIDTILIYYYTKNPADGGSYEGYSYNAYAMDEFMQFAVALKRLNAYNFFNDPQILATFDFMAETLGPLGMPSLYEDCTFSSRLQEVLLIVAANINDIYPDKAKHYQYIWEQRQNNSLYQSSSNYYYSYLNGGSANFRRIICYNINESISAEPYKSRKEIWKESCMAFLRSEEKPNSLFLSFNCKNYAQSHTHYDENSFEIWAFGAYIVNNPGYPGFGRKYHDWTIETEASNTILIAGSGQRQEEGDGLISSISSPYFSMVIGSAKEIYTDYGSFKNAPELYYIIFINFIFIGLACILFVFISKKGEKTKEIEEITEQKDFKKINNSEVRYLSKASLVKNAFLHPQRVQEYIFNNDPYKEDAKFLNRIILMLISGLMVLFFIILMLDIKTMIDYHSQYYEDKYSSIFEILSIIELSIIIIGAILTFLCSIAAIKVYTRLNRFFIYKALENERTSITKRQISSISAISIVWTIPILVFSFFLLYLTTAQSIKEGIHQVFIGLGSITAIYNVLLLIIREMIRNFFIIMIFGIPF